MKDTQKISQEAPRLRYREKHWRSMVKTFSWRILATFTTLVISYLIIGDLKSATLISMIEFFSKIFLYYFHERVWSKTHIGLEAKETETDYQI